MAMGIISDEQLLREINEKEREREINESKTPQVIDTERATIIDTPSKGRGDSVNTPDSLRKIIGEESVINGRQSALALAKEFGISPSSVSAYAKGATSTASYNSPTQSIISHINKSRQRAVKRASKTLNAALGSITQDKLDYADAKDLAGIAKDMSVIIKNLEPQAEIQTDSAPKFVIYAPQFKQENQFDVINVNE